MLKGVSGSTDAAGLGSGGAGWGRGRKESSRDGCWKNTGEARLGASTVHGCS